MNFDLTSSQQTLQAEIIDFAQQHLNEDIVARDQEGRFDRNLWRACGLQKWQGMSIPKAYGGAGYSPEDTAIAFEAIGYGCEDQGLAFAIGAHLFACVIPLWLYGSEEQKKRYLPELSSGALIATHAMTEASGGSAAFQMESRALEVPSGFELKGTKTYCANAPLADICLAYFPTDPDKGFFGGISAFLLEKQTYPFQVSAPIQKMGLRSCQTGQITFDSLFVGKECLLGKEGAGGMIFTKSIEWERMGLSALHLGCMRRLIERTITFVNERAPGGISLSKHQAISHQLAEMKLQLEASKLLVYQAANRIAHAKNSNLYTAMAKLFTSEHYKAMCLKLVQIYGGLGYHAEHEASRSLRDAVAATLYSGTSEIQKNIISRWMGIKI
jgi:alkylation response protein AidB-like acyl-CoA dehydrogenase